MTNPEPAPAFVTTVRVEAGGGPHEYVNIWVRGAHVGTLCVGKGDGDRLRDLLLCQPKPGDAPTPFWSPFDLGDDSELEP